MRSVKSSLPAYTRSVITLRQLLRDVSAGIRVLQTRDGLELSESQITERARNIVAGLIGNYRIESLEVAQAPRTIAVSRVSRHVEDDDSEADTPSLLPP